MLLYEHPLSSYAQKVKIALREKGVAFDVETPTALGSGTAAGPFAAASPRNEVPALIDGEARIFDSTIILEYLEDKFPTPPLLPRDPMARAQARMIEDVCDTLYEAINWGLSEISWFKRAEGAKAEEMRATAARQTAELQAWLTDKLDGRDWFNGDELRLGRLERRALPQPLVPLRPRHARWLAARPLAQRASASGRRSPRPSRSSRPPPRAWAMRRAGWRQARSSASTAIIAWNG